MFVGMGANGASGGYNLENSLRFRSSASAYLNRTPTVAGNRKTFTISLWMKGGLDPTTSLFQARESSSTGQQHFILKSNAGSLYILDQNPTIQIITTAVFRDPSAWYHIVVAIDTTEAIATDRAKIYVNGEKLESFSTLNTFPLNYDTAVNNTVRHLVGARMPNSSTTLVEYLDGYLTEINFVDGQALTPSDFGDYNATTGVWQPIEYEGTYGTNGFYLPFKPTTQATGFNTVTYAGNGGTQSITGVGFEPDLVWIKNRSSANSHQLVDSVRGATKQVFSNTTDQEYTYANGLTSFNADGFSIGNLNDVNNASYNYVGWCWDAGSGSPVSNTDGTITSTVKANPATGFSVVTYTGTGVAGSVGHGLGVVPKLYIIKQRTDAGNNWIVQTTAVDGSLDYLFLNATNAKGNSGDALPTSSVLNISGNNDVNGSGDGIVAYCFSDVEGYQKMGSYTGNGSTTGPVVDVGFEPAFVLIKRTDSARGWVIFDNTRNPVNERILSLEPNVADAEYTNTNAIDFVSNGFQPKSSGPSWNSSGGNYIYLAIADTRDAKFNFDASGNKNNWTANNINSNASGDTTYDIMTDVPTLTDEDTANYATLNPLSSYWNATYGSGTDGNLQTSTYNQGDAWTTSLGTVPLPSSGKYYWEVTAQANIHCIVGILATNLYNTVGTATYMGGASFPKGKGYYGANGLMWENGATSTFGATYTAGDVIGVRADMDTRTMYWYKNNVLQGSRTLDAGVEYAPATSRYSFSYNTWNFGQRPFAYTPPTGYLKLNTFNLPDSSIVDGSENFNTVLWSGNGTSQSITGVGFEPDFVWLKERSSTSAHFLNQANDGTVRFMQSNTTIAEVTNPEVVGSFDSDGFSVGNSGGSNQSGQTYAAWNWKAGDTAVTNTAGTITSQVSANTTAGFSIATFTGNGLAAQTIGHGLSQPPEIYIWKRRDSAENWGVQYTIGDGSVDLMLLNLTNSKIDVGAYFPTATTEYISGGGAGLNANGGTYVAYSFHSVEGYSKMGSYTGNGSTNGTFVYTGFRPAFVIVKKTTAAESWIMIDSTRSPDNSGYAWLYPNLANAEAAGSPSLVDILSNGFKWRNSASGGNTSGTYIYMAFAENPFKNSLAR